MMGASHLLDVGFHFGNFGNRNTVDGTSRSRECHFSSRRCHLSFYCLGTYTSAGDWMYHAVCGSRDCSFCPQAATRDNGSRHGRALRRLPREKHTHPPPPSSSSPPLPNCYASAELSTLTVTPTQVPTREIL
jgi:hypothetical protein